MNEYDEGKIWFKRKGGVVTVGLTEKAFEEIGGLQGLNLPVEGDEFTLDDVVAEVEGDKTTFEVIAPVDGTIVAVNETLEEDLELLANDPLDEGWMFKMKVEKTDNDSDEDDDEE
jgi:glycine cleavage system H protein